MSWHNKLLLSLLGTSEKLPFSNGKQDLGPTANLGSWGVGFSKNMHILEYTYFRKPNLPENLQIGPSKVRGTVITGVVSLECSDPFLSQNKASNRNPTVCISRHPIGSQHFLSYASVQKHPMGSQSLSAHGNLLLSQLILVSNSYNRRVTICWRGPSHHKDDVKKWC